MNSDGNRIAINDSAVITSYTKAREFFIHSLTLAISTLVFITTMILTVYMSQKSSKDKVIVILIVASSLLYILSFASNMYQIYFSKLKQGLARILENSNSLNGTTRSSVQSSFTTGRLPGMVNQHLRNTPPPPYEIQMTEMSRMLFPGTSGATGLSTRESEIREEARKLISRLYEEIKNDRQVAQSPRKEQSTQQVIPKPEIPKRQEGRIIPKVSHPNLVINLHETGVKSVPRRGFSPANFCSKPTTQQKATVNFAPTESSLQRIVIGSEKCAAAPLQPSSKQNFLQVARKRKISTRSKKLPMKSTTKEQSAQVVIGNNNMQDNIYEPIEAVSSSQPLYDSVECHCIDSSEQPGSVPAVSEQPSSACSVAFEPPTADRRGKLQNPTVNVRRTLSAPSSRKFHQLGKSPETVLDAIATGYDLTPEEWMVAWKLGQKGVSPIERAKLLGVDLPDNSSSDSN